MFEGAKVCAKEMHTNTAVRQTDRQTALLAAVLTWCMIVETRAKDSCLPHTKSNQYHHCVACLAGALSWAIHCVSHLHSQTTHEDVLEPAKGQQHHTARPPPHSLLFLTVQVLSLTRYYLQGGCAKAAATTAGQMWKIIIMTCWVMILQKLG